MSTTSKPAAAPKTVRQKLGKEAPPKLDLKKPPLLPLPESPWPKRIGIGAVFLAAAAALAWQQGAFDSSQKSRKEKSVYNTSTYSPGP